MVALLGACLLCLVGVVHKRSTSTASNLHAIPALDWSLKYIVCVTTDEDKVEEQYILEDIESTGGSSGRNKKKNPRVKSSSKYRTSADSASESGSGSGSGSDDEDDDEAPPALSEAEPSKSSRSGSGSGSGSGSVRSQATARCV